MENCHDLILEALGKRFLCITIRKGFYGDVCVSPQLYPARDSIACPLTMERGSAPRPLDDGVSQEFPASFTVIPIFPQEDNFRRRSPASAILVRIQLSFCSLDPNQPAC